MHGGISTPVRQGALHRQTRTDVHRVTDKERDIQRQGQTHFSF